jgi:oligoendopeptidase F
MSNFEDDSFDKIFSEIAKNEQIDNVEKIVNEEKIELIKKYLNIIQSLNNSAIHLNDIVVDLILDPVFSVDMSINEAVEDLYTFSEDFQDIVIKKYKDIDVQQYIDSMYNDDDDDFDIEDDFDE